MTDRMTDSDLMPFGAHKGKSLADVPADYLLWIADLAWVPSKWPRLSAYIDHVREALEMETGNRTRVRQEEL